MSQDFRKPTVHNMKRRSYSHDYSRSGYYHITISTTKALHQPLGQIAGCLDKPDGDSDAPHVVLSPLGQMVEQELRESIQRYYPMLEVMDYVIMPEHLHFLLAVHRDIVSKSGKPTHLGHVIAGFKYGCNKRYWAMTGRAIPANTPTPAAEPQGTRSRVLGDSAGARDTVLGDSSGAGGTVLGDSVAKQASPAKQAAPPLFDAGYCDVMPIDEAQLATQRAYIRANPRSRLLRTTNRQWLLPQRHTVNTAVSTHALNGYLQRESPWQMTPDCFAAITQRLLLENDYVVCDSYGSTALLQRKLLPVVCHRKDAALFEQQKARCLAEAASGAVLVSTRISQGEQNIMDAASALGFPVIRIEDNGFPDIYHPSAQRMDDCAAGRLLLLSPWAYQFRSHTENITTLLCKTMNCIAQAICRQRDDWWK